MRYNLYVKIFTNERGEKDLEMIYTENPNWVKQRDKARRSAHLLEFSIQLAMILSSLAIMALCATINFPEIIFLQALTISLSVTTLIYILFFNTVIFIRYQKLKNWQIEYEKTFEYLRQIAQILEKRKGRTL